MYPILSYLILKVLVLAEQLMLYYDSQMKLMPMPMLMLMLMPMLMPMLNIVVLH